MFKSLPKSKYPTEMLNVLTEYTLIIYVQFILGFQRKTSSLKEKSVENVQNISIHTSFFNAKN